MKETRDLEQDELRKQEKEEKETRDLEQDELRKQEKETRVVKKLKYLEELESFVTNVNLFLH